MQVVWDKLIEGGTTTSDELKTLKQVLQKVSKERKLSEEEEETLDRLETNDNINSVLKDVSKGRVDNFLRDLILNAVLNDRI